VKTTYSTNFLKKLKASLDGVDKGVVSNVDKGSPKETGLLEGQEEILRGGPGSGHFGHSGRRGLVGGSEPGGVAVGRAEVSAREVSPHFKWSGKTQLERSRKPNVSLEIKPGKAGKRFEVNGSVDSKGKQKPGKVMIRSDGKELELDFDELHSIRSAMRYMNMVEDKGVTEIAGKPIARGRTLSVGVGENKVNIPIKKRSMKMIEDAAKAIRGAGYSFTLESDKDILGAVDRIRKGEKPLTTMKNLGFSKAGQMATMHLLNGLRINTGLMDDRVKEKAGYMSQGGKFYMRQAAKKAKEEHKMGLERFDKYSGTQAMKHWKRAAGLVSTAER
jgi:hypothetical protein